jgi:hypothetical protein
MFWFLGHLEDQHPFKQLDRVIVGEHAGFNHRVILLDRKPKNRLGWRGGRKR